MNSNKERFIDYITERGYEYRIVYHKIGACLWEWDILVRVSEKEDDYLGLTFGEEKTMFPEKKMAKILVGYAEYKDDQNQKYGLNLGTYRHIV